MTWGVVATVAVSAVAAKSKSDAAKKAAGDQADIARENASRTDDRFARTREDLRPFREAGVEALNQQRALLGLGGEEERTAAFAAFNNSPGQQFIRERAQKNLLQNSAAIGEIGGGNVRSALVKQGTGFAQQDFNNQFNRLSILTGAGKTATTNTGQFGAQATGNINAQRNLAAQASASGILGAEQLRQRFFGTAARGAGQFFGRR